MSGAVAVLTVPMPRLSDSMEEGTIASWLVADGAAVTRGQEIVEVETDKATMPYEAEADGVLHVLVAAGETVAVGDPIAQIIPEGVEASDPREVTGPTDQQIHGDTAARRVSASPLARRIAAELNIDLAALVGSGPNGRVVKSDVLAARPAPEPQPTPAPDPVPAAEPEVTPALNAANLVPLTRVQRLIAERMTASKQTAPDFVLDVEVDMGAAIAMRQRLKELLGDSKPPSLGDFVIKACGLALREHPRVNGAYRADGAGGGGAAVELFDHVNVGVAVATDDALVVPTVRDADARSLGQISADVRRLAQAARAGRLTPRELDGATFTVSNLGMFGVDAFTAVLNPPQAAILAVGAVREKPVARDGQLVLGRTLTARLSCDHRILNGADGAVFLARVRELLEAPELLAL
ncbi:dihydrolipoamide acetyltransferase family protein [Conexibacter sp. JD483]|uniref:dihydrolipoamide acetyltransferase family protein n=1 Tax=unclassified Conexibacter TaxID=2627773 RepID=UPI00271EDEEC|nr:MULTISPECIES: dihydrolipoamide acetyltransferase family protein [unclassified Conexibacter]MDO8188368.1 dihydrolipoamide acetyltransferase family protein [Conexibacter sp. CPCC 205706]MDO8201114.1 dihydrolipoamide acetyltransferase family protein [Conexibacter sp. CPCC 205762]MDR9371586.1 dihydrolipoamide acetyltransferase family protein [Conexibacter sp. JD483]